MRFFCYVLFLRLLSLVTANNLSFISSSFTCNELRKHYRVIRRSLSDAHVRIACDNECYDLISRDNCHGTSGHVMKKFFEGSGQTIGELVSQWYSVFVSMFGFFYVSIPTFMLYHRRVRIRRFLIYNGLLVFSLWFFSLGMQTGVVVYYISVLLSCVLWPREYIAIGRYVTMFSLSSYLFTCSLFVDIPAVQCLIFIGIAAGLYSWLMYCATARNRVCVVSLFPAFGCIIATLSSLDNLMIIYKVKSVNMAFFRLLTASLVPLGGNNNFSYDGIKMCRYIVENFDYKNSYNEESILKAFFALVIINFVFFLFVRTLCGIMVLKKMNYYIDWMDAPACFAAHMGDFSSGITYIYHVICSEDMYREIDLGKLTYSLMNIFWLFMDFRYANDVFALRVMVWFFDTCLLCTNYSLLPKSMDVNVGMVKLSYYARNRFPSDDLDTIKREMRYAVSVEATNESDCKVYGMGFLRRTRSGVSLTTASPVVIGFSAVTIHNAVVYNPKPKFVENSKDVVSVPIEFDLPGSNLRMLDKDEIGNVDYFVYSRRCYTSPKPFELMFIHDFRWVSDGSLQAVLDVTRADCGSPVFCIMNNGGGIRYAGCVALGSERTGKAWVATVVCESDDALEFLSDSEDSGKGNHDKIHQTDQVLFERIGIVEDLNRRCAQFSDNVPKWMAFPGVPYEVKPNSRRDLFVRLDDAYEKALVVRTDGKSPSAAKIIRKHLLDLKRRKEKDMAKTLKSIYSDASRFLRPIARKIVKELLFDKKPVVKLDDRGSMMMKFEAPRYGYEIPVDLSENRQLVRRFAEIVNRANDESDFVSDDDGTYSLGKPLSDRVLPVDDEGDPPSPEPFKFTFSPATSWPSMPVIAESGSSPVVPLPTPPLTVAAAPRKKQLPIVPDDHPGPSVDPMDMSDYEWARINNRPIFDSVRARFDDAYAARNRPELDIPLSDALPESGRERKAIRGCRRRKKKRNKRNNKASANNNNNNNNEARLNPAAIEFVPSGS